MAERKQYIYTMEGYTVWNKGLTKETDDRVAKYAEKMRGRTKYTHSGIARMAEKRTGIKKVYSDPEGRARRISISERRDFLNGTRIPSGGFKYSHQGYRDDLKHHVRSTWEANVCRIFNCHNIKYEYESKKCRFDIGDLGILIIDWYLPKYSCYVEAKGYLSDKAKEKWLKFLELYSNINVFIIDGISYNNLKYKYADKVIWE